MEVLCLAVTVPLSNEIIDKSRIGRVLCLHATGKMIIKKERLVGALFLLLSLFISRHPDQPAARHHFDPLLLQFIKEQVHTKRVR